MSSESRNSEIIELIWNTSILEFCEYFAYMQVIGIFRRKGRVMKPNWTQDGVWQFISFIFAVAALYVTLLPENQRFLGATIASIGICILSWRLKEACKKNHTAANKTTI